MTQFEVYAPLTTKTADEDGGLIITGVASTTNKDLVGDTITQEAIASMKEQALGLNIYDGHNYGVLKHLIGNIIGIPDSDDDTLVIKGKILPSYREKIQELIDNHIPLGWSIGGNVTDYDNTSEGYLIKDFDLKEISLTGMPANWDTYGTVTTSKGLVKSKCLLGACHTVLKNQDPNNGVLTMTNEEKPTEQPQEPVVSEEIKTEIKTIVDELWSEKEEGLIESITASVEQELKDLVHEELEKKPEPEPAEEEKKGETTTEEDEQEDAKSSEEDKPEEEEDEAKKSLTGEDIIALINKAMDEKQSAFEDKFFKSLDNNREPESHVKLESGKKPDNKKTYTLEETAQILMAKQFNNNPLMNAINQNLE